MNLGTEAVNLFRTGSTVETFKNWFAFPDTQKVCFYYLGGFLGIFSRVSSTRNWPSDCVHRGLEMTSFSHPKSASVTSHLLSAPPLYKRRNNKIIFYDHHFMKFWYLAKDFMYFTVIYEHFSWSRVVQRHKHMLLLNSPVQPEQL